MTRARAVAVATAIACVAAIALLVPSGGGGSDREVHVVFDDSRGLLVGQLVQIAGARVGSITDVSVTEDYKARVHMSIEERFAAFREDATCTIKPSGLIAENYVQCDPGTPDAAPLEGDPPTVPVESTTQPVNLTDLFEVWNTPTRERLGVLLSTLGMGAAGRGEDLNAVLRRANPALALARRTIAMLERQRDDLAAIVDDSERVTHELARDPEAVEGLVRHTGRVATETASHRGALGEGLRRLPGLLEDARPALRSLDELSAAAQPLLADLEDTAPVLNQVSADIPRLAAVARPTLAQLAPVLRDGARTARRSLSLAEVVRDYAAGSLPSAAVAAQMLPTLEDRGFIEDLLGFFYNGTLAAARFDGTSHILPAHVTFTPCGSYSEVPDPGCGAPSGPLERKRERAPRRDTPRREAPARPREDAPSAERPGVPRPRVPRLDELPRLGELPPLPRLPASPPVPDPVNELMDFLFG